MNQRDREKKVNSLLSGLDQGDLRLPNLPNSALQPGGHWGNRGSGVEHLAEGGVAVGSEGRRK